MKYEWTIKMCVCVCVLWKNHHFRCGLHSLHTPECFDDFSIFQIHQPSNDTLIDARQMPDISMMRTCVLGSNTNNNILQHPFTLFSSSNIDLSVTAMWIANMNEPWSSIHKLLTKYTNQIGCGVFKIKEISALMHNKVAHQCCTLAL